MMERADQNKLESFFHKQLLLYRSLLDCLKEERDHLVQLDLDGLWDVSRVKEELCARIKAVRQQIQATVCVGNGRPPLALAEVIKALPTENRDPIRRLSGEVGLLKREVEAYRKGNKDFIDDSLKFIDDLIATVTGGASTRNVYDHRCRMRKAGGQMLLRREV
jgi:hypothetical protein